MSHLINGLQQQTTYPAVGDDRNRASFDAAWRVFHDQEQNIWFWPRSRMMTSGEPYATDGSSNNPAIANAFEENFHQFPSGDRTAYTLSGVSRDSSGNPLGSCTLELYDTATNTLRGTAVSDSAGNFDLQSNINAAHYIVAYKAGSPDVSGTTVNTLIPVFV